jgi:hypothetical protein
MADQIRGILAPNSTCVPICQNPAQKSDPGGSLCLKPKACPQLFGEQVRWLHIRIKSHPAHEAVG